MPDEMFGQGETLTRDDPTSPGRSPSAGSPTPIPPAVDPSDPTMSIDGTRPKDEPISTNSRFPGANATRDQQPSDDLPTRDGRPVGTDRSSVDDKPSESDQPASPDPSLPRYADGTPLDPRAPRFKDGTPVEVEMLQGTHSKHLAQFVSVAPGNYAILVKGLGYARAGNNRLYAFDMRAHMEGRPTEPYDGIPFFGWGADIDVDAMLASDGIDEFVDEPGDPGEIRQDGLDAEAVPDGGDALTTLAPDQRAIANALINNGDDPDATIHQVRKLIHSEGDVTPEVDVRPKLRQLAAESTGDRAAAKHRERVTESIRKRAESEDWSAGRILEELHRSRSHLQRDDRNNVEVALWFLPFLAAAGGGGTVRPARALVWLSTVLGGLGLGVILNLPGDTPQEESPAIGKAAPGSRARTKSKDEESETVTVYRVESGSSVGSNRSNLRILVDSDGGVTILRPDKKMLYLNFDQRQRAIEFLSEKVLFPNQAGDFLPDPVIKSFKVPREFVDRIRQNAIKQRDVRKFQASRSRPQIDDPKKAPDQFGLPEPWIKELRRQIIEGTGRKEIPDEFEIRH